ncbi:hypothetical protein [Occultella gossypii]|uniref:RAMA domain-containing protein n=1 Tax=Occultella gossypii TaxID=2800820 RepID=A0ABS7SA43_9MICO|nr:hypothetical protein [Occultella gossypii]MBZ2197226.1 hypothetical protein [Occultella gossypii]
MPMPSFAFESGHLVPATFGRQGPSRLTPELKSALRRYLLDVLEADLFPISWSDGAEPVLTAMDPAGQVVTAVVVDRVDSATLMRALARAGENAAAPWLTIAGRYRAGVPGFRRDWNAFREARPAGPRPGPQLYLLAGDVSSEVLSGLRVLHGVRVVAVDVRETPTGAPLLEVADVAPARLRVFDGAAVPELAPLAGPAGAAGDDAAGVAVGARGAGERGAGAAGAPVEPAPAGPAPAPAGPAPAGPAPEPSGRTAAAAWARPEPVPSAGQEPAGRAVAPVQPAPVQPSQDRAAATRPAAAAPVDQPAPIPEHESRFAPPPDPVGRPEAGPGVRRRPEPVRASENLRAVAALVDAPVRIVLRSRERDHAAWLREDGVVVLAGGAEHGELTTAAAHLLGHEPADAWSQWRFAEGGLALADARAEVIRTTRAEHHRAATAPPGPGGEPSRRALRPTAENGSRRAGRH